jgi:Predicted metal-dependent hydrolase
MKIYDISMEICHDMMVYNNKEEKRPDLKIVQDYKTHKVYESRIDMDVHTGSHMDAPLHMLEGGATIEGYDLYKCFTKCKVIDLTIVEDKITKEDLIGKKIEKGDFVILKTKNSLTEKLDKNFIFLETSGAEYLFEIGIIGVGIDGLGIERSQPNHETHKILLGNGIYVLEGLRLKDIEEDEYFLSALPLKIKGAEAAPVRAILIKNL